MTLIGQFGLPLEAFPLRTVLATVPDARVEIVRMTISAEIISPYIWVKEDETARIYDAVEEDLSVQQVTVLDMFDKMILCRVTWAEGAIDTASVFADAAGSIISTVGTTDGWVLRVRFEDRDELADFRERLHEAGIDFETNRLVTTEQPHTGIPYGLTPKQTEALLRAWELGYFELPRKTTLKEVATDIGISQQALSDRLQRGHNALIRNTLAGRSTLRNADDSI